MSAPQIAPDGGKGVLRLLTLGGVVRVVVCPRCWALVLAAGKDRHGEQHAADARRDDR